jgi:hypothetical protein
MTPLRLIASAAALCGASAIVAAWGDPKADDANLMQIRLHMQHTLLPCEMAERMS